MSEFELVRYVDHSNVSGTGVVAVGTEMRNGTVVLEWLGDHPSFSVWPDIREMEAVHGHDGDTVVHYTASPRLLAAYLRVVPHLLSDLRIPTTCGPHPDHADRLRLTFKSAGIWRFWVALLEGSTDTATHVEQAGEMRHRFITPDGDLWLEYFTPLTPDDEHPLTTFDREDRG